MRNLRKLFTKTAAALALLLTLLMVPAVTGQAASGTYKQYSFSRMGATSELYTKNYSVFQIMGGFKVVKNGKTVKTVKGNLGNILYSNKDFYYSTYTGKTGNFKFTVYKMTAAGKSTKLAAIKCKGLFNLDAVYNNKLYGHYSKTNAFQTDGTTYLYSVNIKTHKVQKVCTFKGILGNVGGEDQSAESALVASGKLLFQTGDKAIMVNLATGKKTVVSKNVKEATGNTNTSVWKNAKTTYIEQEDAIQKYNAKTKAFEEEASLKKYAQKYDVRYADENAVLYLDKTKNVYSLYMRKAKKTTKLGKTKTSNHKDEIWLVDGPVTVGKNLYFIINKNSKCEIWQASIKTGKAKKVKSSTQELSFRSDGKKIGYTVNDSNLTIKYIYTLK